jgi:hypothetical protein
MVLAIPKEKAAPKDGLALCLLIWFAAMLAQAGLVLLALSLIALEHGPHQSSTFGP